MPDQPRPVWLTDADMATPLDSAFREIVRAKRDAAPADPAEVSSKACCPKADWEWERYPKAYQDWWRDRSDAVLRALGMPHA